VAQALRRYFDRMLIVLSIATPIILVLAAHLAPGRAGRRDELITVAVASTDFATNTIGTTGRTYLVPNAEGEAPAALADTRSTVLLGQAGPIRPTVWYQVAAADNGISPYLLEALHQIETSAAPDGCWPNIEGSGALGPFQFKQATFDLYGVDGNGDGVVDICGFADSLASAANYLRLLGADDKVDSEGTRQALLRYGTDPDRVVDLAQYYRSRANGDFDVSSIELRQRGTP